MHLYFDMVLECSQNIPQLTKLMCWCRQVYKVGWIWSLHMWYLYLFCPTSAVAIQLVAGGHGADSAGDLPAGHQPAEAAGWGDRAPPPRAWHYACCRSILWFLLHSLLNHEKWITCIFSVKNDSMTHKTINLSDMCYFQPPILIKITVNPLFQFLMLPDKTWKIHIFQSKIV